MKVTFADFGPDIASSRLRAKIPQQELAKIGIQKGLDVLIYGKHFIEDRHIEAFDKLVFDVCDDHFAHDGLGDYYRRHVAMADAVTCNSEYMRGRIMEETGREATVVLEPYESDEQEPNIGPILYWYGHKSNLVDLERIAPSLKHPLMVLTNKEGYPVWSKEAHKEAISTPCIVIIPTGKSLAKSENRMVEAIRSGRYVCAEPLPAYESFAKFFELCKIPEHIDRALANPSESIERIKDAQAHIRDKYAPHTIAKQWLEVINGIR
jgi:hypothetical protein